MNKLIAIIAVTSLTAANAAVNITGDYKGTITDGSGTTYVQDLDLTLTGSTGDTTVTATIEDLAGGDTLKTNELYIETVIDTLNLKAGTYKGQNGAGLLQKKSAATNKLGLSTTIGGFGVGLEQASGDANMTIDLNGVVSGISVTVQDVVNDSRYITAAASIGPLAVTVETQDTGVGVNTGVAITTSLASMETVGIDSTVVFIDVNDAAGVTQDDGILGDISDAVTDVTGVVVATTFDIGTITGKYIDKNDATTLVSELERGIMTYSYTKTENVDGVFAAELNISF
jgi:hypothetical protein